MFGEAFHPDAFAIERELGEFAIPNARIQWVNATYITHDTNELAAYFGTIGTEMQVRLANEAARFADVSDLSPDTRRKINVLRGSIVLPAPTRSGAAAELNQLSTGLQAAYGSGRGTMGGQQLTGNEIEARMGTVRNRPADEMYHWNDNAARRFANDSKAGRDLDEARVLGFDDPALWAVA